MEYSEATKKRYMLQKELNEIRRLIAKSILGKSISPPSNSTLSILSTLVENEMDRLLHEDLVSMRNPNGLDAIRLPVEGDSMLSDVPAVFGLSSAVGTEKFQQTLNSELKELMKADVKFPITSIFIKKVIDHTDEYLKKHRLHERVVFGPEDNQLVEIDYAVARDKRNRLCIELKMIRSRARESEVDANLLLKLLYSEISRLSGDIGAAILSAKNISDEMKIPAEGVSMLSRVPDKYGLSSTAETEIFIQSLSNELRWVMSLAGKFPVSFQFIQRVIGYAEKYMTQKLPFEVAVFGRSEA